MNSTLTEEEKSKQNEIYIIKKLLDSAYMTRGKRNKCKQAVKLLLFVCTCNYVLKNKKFYKTTIMKLEQFNYEGIVDYLDEEDLLIYKYSTNKIHQFFENNSQ